MGRGAVHASQEWALAVRRLAGIVNISSLRTAVSATWSLSDNRVGSARTQSRPQVITIAVTQ